MTPISSLWLSRTKVAHAVNYISSAWRIGSECRGLAALRFYVAAHARCYASQAPTDETDSGRARGGQDGEPAPSGLVDQPAAILRQLFERLPSYPTTSSLQLARERLDEVSRGVSIAANTVASQRRDRLVSDADAIVATITALLQSTSRDCYWARTSLPELLLLLSRLRIPSNPKLEVELVLLLRRGRLPTPAPEIWQELAVATGVSRASIRRRQGGRVALRPPPPLPTAFRLAIAMANLPVQSHEAWQQLARHMMLQASCPLDVLSPDQLTLVAAAFARSGYHPVELFRSIADRLLPAVPRLQPGSLARTIHAFASLHHYDPQLAAALCDEIHRRMRGGAAAADGSAGAAGGSSASPGGFLSLAGAALFGGRGGGPDRAHRAPQFLLEDLSRLAVAAVRLGAERRAAGGGDGGLGEELIAAVAEEAEDAVAQYLRRAMDGAARAAAGVGAGGGGGEGDEDRSGGGGCARSMPAAASTSTLNAADGGVGNAGCSLDQEGEDGEADEGEEFGGVGSQPFSISSSMGSAGGGIAGRSCLAEQLEPVMVLLEALVTGGTGSSSPSSSGSASAAAAAAQAIASKHLVPELPSLEPHLQPHHLVTLLAALLPAGAPALRASAHAYPTASPPPAASAPPSVPPARGSPSRSLFSRAGSGATAASSSKSAFNKATVAAASGAGVAVGGSIGDQLAAIAAALGRRAEPRTARDMRQLFLAWHALGGARVAGAPGSDDPRVVGALAGPVMASALRHAEYLGSPGEVARFVVSCAMLSVYDKPALDAMTAHLVAATSAMGGGGGSGNAHRQPPQQQRGSQRSGGGRFATVGGGGGGGLAALSPTALAHLAWAVGQLGYDNEELLAGIQSQALALSAPPTFAPAPLHFLQGGSGSGAASAAAPGRAGGSGSGGGGSSSSGGAAAGALLGPLELADVMWALAVNQYRSNRGAELRDLYMRAACQGVVRIDDPRWLRLVRVHVLLLLGWAGGLGEQAAAQLRSGWFHALGYAWEQQAMSRGEQLAGPTGMPPEIDPAAAAFRQSVLTSARELLRSPGGSGLWSTSTSSSVGSSGSSTSSSSGSSSSSSSVHGVGISNSGSSGGGGGGIVGSWRLQPCYVWGMLQPSADIRLTLPLLASQAGARAGRGGRGRGQGSSDAFVGGAAGSGGSGFGAASGAGDWMVALDLVLRSDEAMGVAEAEAHAAAQGAAEAAGTGAEMQVVGQELRQGQQQGHLLGPAVWRQLVLRQLGLLMRPIRQAEWEGAGPGERREMLMRALRV